MLQMYGAMQGAFAAGRAVGEMQEKIVSRFDQDRSGDLSVEEAEGNDRLARKFARIDANDDGSLSAQEVGDFLSRRAARDTFGGFGSGFGGSFGEFGMGALNRLSGYAAKMSMEDYLTERAQPDAAAAEAADARAEAEMAAVDTFDALDGDGDGALSDAEIQAEIARKEAEMAAEQARQAKIDTVARIDTDGDGVLSLAELQAEMQARQDARAEAEFDALDTDGDGTLSDAEIAAGVAAQTPAGDAASVPGETAPAPAAPAAASAPSASQVDAAEAGPDAAPVTANAAPSAPPAEPAQSAAASTAQTAPSATPDVLSDGGQAEAPGQVLSMIENVFQTMMDNQGISTGMPGDVGALSQSLYSEAQEMLIAQMQNATDFAAATYGDADDSVSDARATA